MIRKVPVPTAGVMLGLAALGRLMRRLHLEKTRAGALFRPGISVDMVLQFLELQREMGEHQVE